VNLWRQLRAIVLLPGMVAVAIPAVIVWRTDAVSIGWGLPRGLSVLPVALGSALVGIGLLLVARTIALFASVGRGTLAPLGTHHPARRPRPLLTRAQPDDQRCSVRPAREAAVLGSPALLIWFGAVFAVNAVYLPLVEEPGLSRRFGASYEVYRAHVPRWLPRLRPWDPAS
jgi:hypothetical protein